MEIIQWLNSIFWGYLVASVLLGSGIYFAFKLQLPQVRYFTKLIRNLKDGRKSDGGVSGFSALCAALGGQVGTGSLVGVAAALASGGPGAIFWMWMTAILGMGVAFCEAILAQLFRKSNGDGTFRGGPAYYMSYGMNNKILAMCFSASIIVGIGVFYVMIQGNSIALAATGVMDINPITGGVILCALVAAVTFGGIKRLADVATYLVPAMAAIYIFLTLFIILSNFTMIDDVFFLIIEQAFNFDAAAGGAAGSTIVLAFRYGIARGLFSNDAGNGTAPSMHATAQVKHPVNQGMSAMLGVFFTTIIVCTCTAFTILITGALDSGETGILLTQKTFDIAFGDFGKFVVFAAIFLFSFTTLLADIYYGEVNLQWFSNKKFIVTGYRILACALIVISTIIPVSALWDLIDFASAFMVFFNVIALVYLLKYVKYVVTNYDLQKKRGVALPEWDYDIDITKVELAGSSIDSKPMVQNS